MLWLLSKFFSEEAAKALAPLAKYIAIGLGVFMVYSFGVSHGKQEIRADIAEKVDKARQEAMERYFERAEAAQVSYEKALQIVSESRQTAPQIIREIRNAPPTACSAQPVGADRVRLLNAAITGSADREPGSWGPTRPASAPAEPSS